VADVVQLTSLLRSSDDPQWVGIRRELTNKGLDPGTLALATSFPDDRRFEYGIVVTPEGHVFQYGYDYLDTEPGEGTFTEWSDETDRWREGAHGNDVAAAMKLATRRPSTDDELRSPR
jgi:hypothetical protein